MRVALPVVLIGLGVGSFAALKATRPEPTPVQSEEKAWIVAVERVSPAARTPVLGLYGTVESPRVTELSAALSADVTDVAALEGERVSAGQRLVTLDAREVRLQIAQQEAEIADLRAQLGAEQARHENDRVSIDLEEKVLALAERAVARARDLARSQAGSEAQLDDARQALARQRLAVEARRLSIREHDTRVAQLEARIARARAALERAVLDLERTRIAAPFAGRVTEVPVSVGDRVRAGDRLATLYATDSLEIRAQIPSRHLPGVRDALAAGRALTARATVDRRPVRATLDRLTARVERGSGGVDALFRVAEEGEFLEIGRTVELLLALPPVRGAVALPPEALYGTDRIYRLDGERMQALTVERLGDVRGEGGARVLVRSPELRDGDRVVVTQLANAIEGLRVRVAEEREAPAGQPRPRDHAAVR